MFDSISVPKFSNKIFYCIIVFVSVILILIYSLRFSWASVEINISSDSGKYHGFGDDTAASILRMKKEAQLDINNTLDAIISRMTQVALSKGGIDVKKLKKDSDKRNEDAKKAATMDGVKSIRNVPPYPYIMGDYGHSYLHNSSCAPFPNLFEIRFTNTHWQSQSGATWIFHIFSAYWDSRELNEGGPSVRILGIADRVVENVTAFCQIWFEHEKSPKIFPVVDFDISWKSGAPNYRKYNGVFPYIWNCPVQIGVNDSLPISVSVVENICDAATTNVRIHYDNPLKKDKVAVCVRAMNIPDTDISIRLVEWLQILKFFGAHKIFIYQQNVHPNVSKVYEYYKETGFVDSVQITFPEGLSNDAALAKAFEIRGGFRSWMTEILPLNDCLYRNMYKYEYLAVLDTDEIIVPNESETWPQMIQDMEIGETDVSSFAFPNTIFHPEGVLESHKDLLIDVPQFLNMIQEINRGCESRPLGHGTKYIHNTSRVKILHNQDFPFQCFGRCNSVEVNESSTDAQHHRFGLFDVTFCEDDTFFIEPFLSTWKNKIINETTAVLKKLNLV